jgi:hypothetical protein
MAVLSWTRWWLRLWCLDTMRDVGFSKISRILRTQMVQSCSPHTRTHCSDSGLCCVANTKFAGASPNRGACGAAR